MALVSEVQHVYYIRCCGCYRRARLAFHRIVAIGYAKKQGYTRHVTLSGTSTEVVWLCKVCSKSDIVLKTLEENSPPKPATTAKR